MREQSVSGRVAALLQLLMAPGTLANALGQRFLGWQLFHLPCAITLLTGHHCPGCGLTRALSHLWVGEWRAAVALNWSAPAVFLLLILLFCLQVRRLLLLQRELFTLC